MAEEQGIRFVRPESRRYRPLSDDEYTRLRGSVSAVGLLHSILLFEGAVLDGVHRLQACGELGIEPVFLDVTGSGDPAQMLEACNATHRLRYPHEIALLEGEHSKPITPTRPALEPAKCTTVPCRPSSSMKQAVRYWRQDLPFCYAHMRDAIPPLIFGFFLMALMVIGGIIDSWRTLSKRHLCSDPGVNVHGGDTCRSTINCSGSGLASHASASSAMSSAKKARPSCPLHVLAALWLDLSGSGRCLCLGAFQRQRTRFR